MDTLFNLTAIKGKMENPPKGQRLNNFFDGAVSQLDDEQIDNIIDIIQKHDNDIVNFLLRAKSEIKLSI